MVSSTLGASDWENTTVISGDAEEEVAALKREGTGSILVAGSRMLAQALLAAGLVDEIHLQVFPLILGSGRRLYRDAPDKTPLELVESVPLSSGVLTQTYRPVAS